jgi:N-acetylmuramoyl-L-alanine amidase
MAAREKAPDGAEPLIIQEGGEPTSKDDKPADKLESGPAKERLRRPTADVSDPRNDAGHGDHDRDALSPFGDEKDFALDMVGRVGRKLGAAAGFPLLIAV